MNLYAATTRRKGELARERGLTRPFRAAYEREHALDLARMKGAARGDEPDVIEVMVDPRNLRVDDAAWTDPSEEVLRRYGVESYAEWHDRLREGTLPKLPRDERDWRTSLEVVGWVVHEGVVPPENVF